MAQELLNKLGVLTNDLKLAEKRKVVVKQQLELKKIQRTSLLQELTATLAEEEVALRSAVAARDRFKERLRAVTSSRRVDTLFLASEKLAKAKRQQFTRVT